MLLRRASDPGAGGVSPTAFAGGLIPCECLTHPLFESVGDWHLAIGGVVREVCWVLQ